jgi:hypothetical protein
MGDRERTRKSEPRGRKRKLNTDMQDSVFTQKG